jgi:hypothetical protein
MTSHREHTYQALSKDAWPTSLRTMHTKPSLPYQIIILHTADGCQHV